MVFSRWFIENSNKITLWTTIAIMLIAIIYLVVLSIMVQDLEYPREHPWLFTLETLLFSFGASSVIFLMAYGRGDLGIHTVYEFFIFALKFGLLNILLQFSGFYKYSFGK